MFRRIVTLLSIAAVFCVYTIPASAQTTEEQLKAQFEAELYGYSLTHSREEVAAYAQYRLDSMTMNAYNGQTTVLEAGISRDVLDDDTEDFISVWLRGETSFNSLIYLDEDRDPYNSLLDCTHRKWDECRDQYNASLFTSAALATGIFAGCNGITALTGFIACTAGALAAHGLQIKSASITLESCAGGAYQACRREMGLSP
jgi:hypothetical protein